MGGAAILANKVPKRNRFLLRAVGCFVMFCLLRYLFFYVIVPLVDGDGFNYVIRDFGFFWLAGLLFASVSICYKTDAWVALFCAATSYCVQHICQRTYTVFSRLLIAGNSAYAVWDTLLFIGLIVLFLAALFFLLRVLHIEAIVVNNKYVLILSIVVLFACITSESWSSYARRVGGETLWYYSRFVNIFIAWLAFFLQICMLSLKNKDMVLERLKDMIEEARKQYQFEKTTIDMLNIKCHDIKHRYDLDKISSEKERAELKKLVDLYDSSLKTGNVALDVVLTKKNFVCKEKGIELTCMAMGDELNFMDEGNVYALFGNILDNAIEATEKLSDRAKRVVTLSVDRRNDFLYIEEENFYEGNISYSDGLPITTKGNTDVHGFGMKSVQYIVKQYGGSLKISPRNDRFSLSIMIPV
jgi:hypothetical protein